MGVGLAEILAPGRLAAFIGIRDTRRSRLVLRVLGLRELSSGIGILSGHRPVAWMRSRLVGDAIDLGLLALTLTSPRENREGRAAVALLAVAGVTTLDFLASRHVDSPRTLSSQAPRPIQVSGAITISRSPDDIYKFWRDFQNLSRFMAHVESVRVIDNLRSRWVVTVAGKAIHWDATITEDRAGEVIGWRTLEGADVAQDGEVRFSPAPGGRGTNVVVNMRVIPPGGPIGGIVAGLARPLPRIEIGSDLRRLKQVIELGEIVHSDASIHVGPHPARPTGKSSRKIS